MTATARVLPAASSIVSSADRPQPDASVLGGKGAQLAELDRLGLTVPEWLCLPTWCAESGTLPRGIEAELLLAFDSTFGRDALVAVRSSAETEDSASASFAGQLESFLFVGRDALLARVRDCLASGRTPRVARYRELQGVEGKSRVAVILQRMVDATSSGVLFTANPTTGDLGEAVISAAYGLGEGVVVGKADCDTWYADATTGEVRRRSVQHKREQVIFDATQGQGTRIAAVPVADAHRPVLSDAQLQELVTVGRRIAGARGMPQDIEWAYDAAGRLHVLQARAITTLGDKPTGHASTFDNANIVESYPGLTSPLTFSFIRDAYARTFRPAAARFGIPADRIAAHDGLFQHLVALLDGRVFYNLENWYQLYRLVPGFESRLEAWEKALGLEPAAKTSTSRGRLGEKLAVSRRIASQLFTLGKEARGFLSEMDAIFTRERARKLETLDAHALLDALDQLGRDIYPRFAVTLVNDFYAQQLYDLVGKLVTRWNLAEGDATELCNGLFCGGGAMESVAPARSVLRIADEIRRSPAAKLAFTSSATDAELWAQLRVDPRLALVRGAFLTHLEAYGDRTLHELKLETPSLAEEPGLLVAAVRNCVRGGQQVEALETRERLIRAEAEAKVRRALRGHPLRSAIFWRVLNAARRCVGYRESMRLARTRAYGIAKRLYRAIAERLVSARVLAEPGDVFFLTTDEVAGAVRGTGVTGDLQAVIALRRAEYARHEEKRLPGRFTVRGVVAAGHVEEVGNRTPPGARQLQGTGCSRGIVRGKAKVILEPRGDLRVDGEILIAPMTDPGWVLLMVSAAGIVSERGSPLSHTAIVGRELGIPTVVGVPDATRLIASGQEVLLDGGLGTVVLPEVA